MVRMKIIATVSSVILLISFNLSLIKTQEDTPGAEYNETICGTISNDTKNMPFLFNLDPSIEDIVPERGYLTDVEVNYYNSMTGDGKTYYASEAHNFILRKKEDADGKPTGQLEPQLVSSRVDLRFPSEEKDQERIINFRSEDAQGNFHSETFVLSWNKRPGQSEKEFKPCQTYTDRASDPNGGNNLPDDVWPSDDFVPRPMLKEVTPENNPYDWLLGPSAVLEQARVLAERGEVKYNGQVQLTEPNVLADVWTYCKDYGPFKGKERSYVVKFYFTVADEVTGPDGGKIQILPQPIKVLSSKNGGEEVQTMTFSAFQLLERNMPINVPLRMGCQRLNTGDPSDPGTSPDGSPAPPLPDDFFKTDFEIEMEIITRSGDDSFTSSSGSNAKFYHLANYNMTSITQTEMDILGNGDSGDTNGSTNSVDVESVRYKQRSVIDLNDLFLYQIKVSTSECKITQPLSLFNATSAWDMVPPMTFMMGSTLKLFRRDVWTVNSQLTFMGKRLERGIPVLVYEKDYEDIFVDELGQAQVATVTQFFSNVQKGARYENPFTINGAPLKIVVTVWDGAKETINRDVTVNIYKFKSGIIDEDTKVREFGITDCFDESYQSDWFQVVFAIETLPLIEEAIGGKSGEIKKTFRETLDVAYDRLPVVDVDYNDAGLIIISAQLLDRPDWYYLFSMPIGGQIKSGPLTRSTLLETPAACAKMCLKNDDCTDFSYCNNMECDLFLGGNTHGARMEVIGTSRTGDGNEMNDCVVYSKSAAANKKINEQILDDIETTINRKNFKITINFVNETGFEYDKELTAIEFRRDVAPGFGDWKDVLPKLDAGSDSTLTNHWINDYEIKFKGRKFIYDKNDQDGNAVILGKGISSCADLCNEDERCNSFSFCNGKNLECVVTRKHGSEITNENTATDSNCNVISKNFLSDYEKHPNMRIIESASFSQLVNSDVDCAKLCSTNKSLECESFDFCENVDELSETGSAVCLTHKYHMAMTSETDRDTQIVKLDLNSTICEHYTKKYTKDYTRWTDRKLKSDQTVSQSVEGLPLESCALTCSEQSNSCSSFEYCETISPDSPTDEVTTNTRSKPSRSCKLVNTKLANVKQDTDSNENCLVYVISKTAQVRGRNVKGSPAADSSGGVSPVAVGLVSVLFLVLGAVGGVYGYKWYQNRTVE